MRSKLRFPAPAARVRLLTLLLAASLGGCATLDEDECRTADWRLIGYEDGAAGHSASRVGKYREACAEHGISPDVVAYREGRETGLREYCRAANGYRLGNGGKGYAGVCPADMDEAFQAAYDAGRRVYLARSRVNHTHKRIRSKERELDELKKNYAGMTRELVEDGTTSARRAELFVETARMVERQGRLQAQIEELRVRLEKEREELEALESRERRWRTGEHAAQSS